MKFKEVSNIYLDMGVNFGQASAIGETRKLKEREKRYKRSDTKATKATIAKSLMLLGENS